MILFPAIDLYGGKVVRLAEGDFAKKTSYDVSPLVTAKKYRDAGSMYIHVVDLEGAMTGAPCHLSVLRDIVGLGMFVQYGGGLRSAESVKSAVEAGADRVMIGSLLFKDPEMPAFLYNAFGKAAMPAIDVRANQVVHSGWLTGTGQTPLTIIKELHHIGFAVFLVTDTERDGLLKGYREHFYTPLLGDRYGIVAAGGVTSAQDIAALARDGLSGAVVGKSLYEGCLTIEAALAAARGEMI